MITTGRSSPFDAAARTTTPTRRATPRRRRRAASDERRRRPRPRPVVVVVAAVDRAARPRAGDALAIVVVVVAATLIVSIARRVPRRGEMLCRRAARAATLPTEAEARDERGWRVSVITRSSVVLSARARALALKIKTWHPPSSPHRPSRGDAALLDGRHARAGVFGLRLRGRLRRRRLGRGGRGPPRRGPRRRGERI